MIVRIGVSDTAKEIEVDMGRDADPAEVKASIEGSIDEDAGLLWLTDKEGRQVGVPVAKIAYVDIGVQSAPRIGFGA
jgi:hypothetical protein